jgi:hypothetical protein
MEERTNAKMEAIQEKAEARMAKFEERWMTTTRRGWHVRCPS